MKKIILSAVIASLFIMSAPISNSFAAEKQLDPRLVFEIGGKAKVKQRRNRMIPVGGGVRWKTPMCGNFDMSLSVTNILNGVTGQVEKLGNDLVASVTGVVSNWAMIEIARADPQLYEFLQQGKVEASELFNGSVASCEEMTDKIIREGYGGAGPGGWVEASGFEDWSSNSEPSVIDNKDAVKVDEEINKNKGDNGLSWIGGDKAAGKDQPPIEVEKDAIKAGYNQLANRDVKSKSPIQESDTSPWYVKYWSEPSEAEKWITTVIGTTTLRTCQDCERLKTTSGKGVYSILEEEQRRIESKLLTLVDAPVVVYDEKDLEEVSAPGYGVTQQVMEALKGESIYQNALVERMAEEIAIAGTVERLIAARRILLSGKREANIAQNSDAVEILNSRISELGEEMNLLRQDAELRSTTKSSVAVTILERKAGRDQYNNEVPKDDVSKALRSITGRE
ncbi:integrating conjugative element protein [Shewanella baltica]|uniref:integrating conjugative element protein n=1 Tax=Shewanella baltica TaxID=62322 RepID=UPI00217E56A5|nr:integrating conjugative element protein [Shewanella baltica]MCS6271821.1 integrating conjugative element protein [Shewanella baltica]